MSRGLLLFSSQGCQSLSQIILNWCFTNSVFQLIVNSFIYQGQGLHGFPPCFKWLCFSEFRFASPGPFGPGDVWIKQRFALPSRMLLPPLLIFFPGIIPSQRDGSFGLNSIFHFDSMSSRFQKSEEGTNFRHSVQGKNLSPFIWKGNFGNRSHDDYFSRWFATPSGILNRK